MLGASEGTKTDVVSAADRRIALRRLAEMADDGSPPMARIDDRAAPGPDGPISVRIYTPLTAPAGASAGLVFLHGGGWVAGDLDTHDGLCRRLAESTCARVVAVDYRLAPEHRFPAALLDSLAATRWVADNARALDIDPDRLAIGGDSVGGGLAAAVCQQARREGDLHLALQVLICPILDLAHDTPSRRAFGEGYFISRAALARDLNDYCPGADRTEPRLSPGLAPDLGGLPPALVHTAEFDPFRDEGEAYAARLAQAGTRVSTQRHLGMIHYFYALARAIPYGRTASETIGEEFRRMLEST